MAVRPIGTVTGRDADGQLQTISIGRNEGIIQLTSHTLDHHHVEAPDATSIENMLALTKTRFGLVDATFIPAHGATGGRS